MDADQTPSPRVAVLGGGISGLTAAKRLADAGFAVDVYEASARLGGKIETRKLGDSVVEAGAEFVDSTHAGLRDLCKELGVGLTPANDQSTIVFRKPDGAVLSNDAFFAAAKPVQDKIIRDKTIVDKNPDGERALHINAMSMTDYLRELNGQLPETGAQTIVSHIKNLWARTKNLFNSSKVPSDILATYSGAYVSESGRDPQSVNALQFVRESSSKSGELLASDCAFRVEGGTEQIILALQRDLAAKGVQFHMNSRAASVAKNSDGVTLSIEGGGAPVTYDQVVLGMPMHKVADLKGVEKLGLGPQDMQLLRDGQYTHNAKFSVRVNASAPDSTLFSADGIQAWRSAPDVMTFLVGGEKLNAMKGEKLVDYCLDKYAAATGKPASELFDKSQIMFRGPDSARPCYASPAPGQASSLAKLRESVARLAQNGIGVAGSYLPGDEGSSVGFMECGVESANRSAALLIAQARATAQSRIEEEALSRGQEASPGWRDRETQRKRVGSELENVR